MDNDKYYQAPWQETEEWFIYKAWPTWFPSNRIV